MGVSRFDYLTGATAIAGAKFPEASNAFFAALEEAGMLPVSEGEYPGQVGEVTEEHLPAITTSAGAAMAVTAFRVFKHPSGEFFAKAFMQVYTSGSMEQVLLVPRVAVFRRLDKGVGSPSTLPELIYRHGSTSSSYDVRDRFRKTQSSIAIAVTPSALALYEEGGGVSVTSGLSYAGSRAPLTHLCLGTTAVILTGGGVSVISPTPLTTLSTHLCITNSAPTTNVSGSAGPYTGQDRITATSVSDTVVRKEPWGWDVPTHVDITDASGNSVMYPIRVPSIWGLLDTPLVSAPYVSGEFHKGGFVKIAGEDYLSLSTLGMAGGYPQVPANPFIPTNFMPVERTSCLYLKL